MTVSLKQNNHGLANEYKFLCEKADDMMKKPEYIDVGLGWKKLESYKDHGANFKMATTGESR